MNQLLFGNNSFKAGFKFFPPRNIEILKFKAKEVNASMEVYASHSATDKRFSRGTVDVVSIDLNFKVVTFSIYNNTLKTLIW